MYILCRSKKEEGIKGKRSYMEMREREVIRGSRRERERELLDRRERTSKTVCSRCQVSQVHDRACSGRCDGCKLRVINKPGLGLGLPSDGLCLRCCD